MTRRFALALIGGLVPALARLASAAPPRLRVLILDGYSNHDWRLTTALIRGFLEPTGLFTVDVATAPPTADAPGWDTWRPVFANYDAVIQTCNDFGGGPAWPRPVREDFESFVRKGGGVYVWHGGNNAFPDWPAYNEMIGLGWRKKDFGWAIAIAEDGSLRRIPAGEGLDTGHGDRVDTVVHRRGDHPIHGGLPRAWLTPDIEVYHYARGPAQRLEVLSYGFDPKTQMHWPLEWTTTYSRGRVYTSTFGHVLASARSTSRSRYRPRPRRRACCSGTPSSAGSITSSCSAFWRAPTATRSCAPFSGRRPVFIRTDFCFVANADPLNVEAAREVRLHEMRSARSGTLSRVFWRRSR